MTNVCTPRLFLHQDKASQIVSFLGAASAASAINFRIKNILWNRKFGPKSSPGTCEGVDGSSHTCIYYFISIIAANWLSIIEIDLHN